MTQPVAISRNQDAVLRFYSWLDISAVLGFLLLFGVGTLVVGSRRRRAHRLTARGDRWPMIQSTRAGELGPDPPPPTEKSRHAEVPS